MNRHAAIQDYMALDMSRLTYKEVERVYIAIADKHKMNEVQANEAFKEAMRRKKNEKNN